MIILLIITIFIHHYLLYFEEGWREFHCRKVCWHHKEAFAKINSEKQKTKIIRMRHSPSYNQNKLHLKLIWISYLKSSKKPSQHSLLTCHLAYWRSEFSHVLYDSWSERKHIKIKQHCLQSCKETLCWYLEQRKEFSGS